jgi:adenylate kinase family enzyme
MVNYGKSKIYKIQKIGGDSEIYIGSTTKDYLSQRMDKHRSGYKYWKLGHGRFITSFKLFDLYGVENCEIVLLESVNCNSKDELRAREGFHIKDNICVNKNVAGRSIKDYRDNNKESIKEKYKIYYETNKESIKDNKKLYYETNKENIKERVNKYNEINKEKLKLQFTCDCGCKTSKKHKSRHFKSNKHLKLLEKLKQFFLNLNINQYFKITPCKRSLKELLYTLKIT